MSGIKFKVVRQTDVRLGDLKVGTCCKKGNHVFMVILDPDGHMNNHKNMNDRYVLGLVSANIGTISASEMVSLVEIRGTIEGVSDKYMYHYLDFD